MKTLIFFIIFTIHPFFNLFSQTPQLVWENKFNQLIDVFSLPSNEYYAISKENREVRMIKIDTYGKKIWSKFLFSNINNLNILDENELSSIVKDTLFYYDINGNITNKLSINSTCTYKKLSNNEYFISSRDYDQKNTTIKTYIFNNKKDIISQNEIKYEGCFVPTKFYPLNNDLSLLFIYKFSKETIGNPENLLALVNKEGKIIKEINCKNINDLKIISDTCFIISEGDEISVYNNNLVKLSDKKLKINDFEKYKYALATLPISDEFYADKIIQDETGFLLIGHTANWYNIKYNNLSFVKLNQKLETIWDTVYFNRMIKEDVTSKIYETKNSFLFYYNDSILLKYDYANIFDKISYIQKINIEKNNNLKIEKKIALIIGNAEYKNAPILINTLNDARDLSQRLIALGFEVIKYENLQDKNEVNNAIINFGARAKNYDLALFYYSGHGLQVNGANYIVPTQVILNSEGVVKTYCVDASNIIDEMTAAQCKYKMVIMDACRDNPFEKSWTSKSIENNGKGLAEMRSSANTVVIFATAPGKTASDNPSGRNGLFTQELLKNLNEDYSIDQIFKFTGKGVSQISNFIQIPWISSSLFDDVYLKK